MSLDALNRLAIRCAERVRDSQPRADLTLAQLPLLAAPAATDILPVYHNGQTYGTPWSAAVGPPGPPGTSAINANTDFSKIHWYNVKFYGAVGDGITDDTTAIQNAINAAVADTAWGIVFFPGNTYKISAALTLSGPCGIMGEQQIGVYSAGVGSTAILQANLSADVFTFINSGGATQITGLSIQDIQIRAASGASGSGGIGFHFQNCQIVEIRRCSVSGMTNGFLFDGTGGVTCYDCSFAPLDSAATPKYGFKCTGAHTGNPNLTALINCNVTEQFNTNKRICNAFVLANNYNTLNLYNCQAESTNFGVWSTSDGGAAPNFLSIAQLVTEGCQNGMQLDNGGNFQCDQWLSLTTFGNDCQIASTYSGGPLAFTNIQLQQHNASAGNAFVIANPAGVISITGGSIFAVTNGIVLQSAANVTVNGVNIFSNTGDGIQVTAAFTSLLTITGCNVYSNNYGIHATGAGSGTIQAAGNSFLSNTTYDIDIVNLSSTGSRFTCNRLTSVTSSNIHNLATPGTPGSSGTVVNNTGLDAQVYLGVAGGGTLSVCLVNGISVPAFATSGSVPNTFRVRAGGSITPTFSGTIAWTWIFDP